jgi:prevent-host-death family protein
VRELSASEASRNFSAVLDAAEHGETIVVRRGGRPVALIAPAPRANGKALLSVCEKWHRRAAFDERFAENVAGARQIADGGLDADPWRD